MFNTNASNNFSKEWDEWVHNNALKVLPSIYYDGNGDLLEYEDDVPDDEDMSDDINAWFDDYIHNYVKLSDEQIEILHLSPIICNEDDDENVRTCIGDTVELAGAGQGYSRIVGYDGESNTYKAWDMKHGSGLSGILPANIVDEYEYGERAAMGMKVAALLMPGWIICDWTMMYDSEGNEHTLEATQIVLKWHEQTGLWVTLNFEGSIGSYDLSEMSQVSLVWQHTDHPFKKYSALGAIGGSPKYHKTLSGDEVTLRLKNGEERYQVMVNSATNQHHLLHPTVSSKTKKNFNLNCNELIIADRQNVKKAITKGITMKNDLYGPTDLFDLRYHMVGSWRVHEKILGDLKECIQLAPPSWKTMIFSRNRGLVNLGTHLSLTVKDVKFAFSQGHRIWLRFTKLKEDDAYETESFPSNYEGLKNHTELLDARKLLTNNEEACQKYMNKLASEAKHNFEIVIYRQVVNAVSACNAMIDSRLQLLSEEERPSMNLKESDDEYVLHF